MIKNIIVILYDYDASWRNKTYKVTFRGGEIDV